MIADAQAHGLVVLLDPIDLGGCNSEYSWVDALRNNGDGTLSTTNNDYKYGQALGNEFKDLSNIIWMSGNDFQCVNSDSTVDDDALSVAAGIRNTDRSALQTVELDYCGQPTECIGSTSLVNRSGDGTAWGSTIDLNQAYTYAPTYADVRAAYSQSSTQPAFIGRSELRGGAEPRHGWLHHDP